MCLNSKSGDDKILLLQNAAPIAKVEQAEGAGKEDERYSEKT